MTLTVNRPMYVNRSLNKLVETIVLGHFINDNNNITVSDYFTLKKTDTKVFWTIT